MGGANVVEDRGLVGRLPGDAESAQGRLVGVAAPAQRAEWLRWRRDGWVMAGVAAAGGLFVLLARRGTSP
jgi:hypothetical protein